MQHLSLGQEFFKHSSETCRQLFAGSAQNANSLYLVGGLILEVFPQNNARTSLWQGIGHVGSPGMAEIAAQTTPNAIGPSRD